MNGGICGFSHFKDLTSDIEFEYVINLPGEFIVDKKWSEEQKR